MQIVWIENSVERIAVNVLAADGTLAYTLRAEPDSPATCPLELTEHETDGGVLDTLALSRRAAEHLAELLMHAEPPARTLDNHRRGDLRLRPAGEILIVEDGRGRHAVDLWNEPDERVVVARVLRQAAQAFAHQCARQRTKPEAAPAAA